MNFKSKIEEILGEAKRGSKKKTMAGLRDTDETEEREEDEGEESILDIELKLLKQQLPNTAHASNLDAPIPMKPKGHYRR